MNRGARLVLAVCAALALLSPGCNRDAQNQNQAARPAPPPASGAASAQTINGAINDGMEKEHLIQATRGQTLNVGLTADAEDVFLSVMTPGGEWLTEDEHGPTWTGQAPETGNYRIIVSTLESETATYKIEVSVR